MNLGARLRYKTAAQRQRIKAELEVVACGLVWVGLLGENKGEAHKCIRTKGHISQHKCNCSATKK